MTLKSEADSGLVTVVIANYNRCNDLREALQSVKDQDYTSVEVIVVDNASEDDSPAMAAKEFPDVLVIACNENMGMDGYSVGFRRATGEFIFQMDNDSLMPDASVLTEVVERFRHGPPDLAVVATRVEEYRKDGEPVNDLRQKDRRRGPINTGGFHSGGVGFRRSLLDLVGYYNRDVFLYGSELFLQMKFLAAGYKILYYPEILMLHKSSGIARSNIGLYYEIRNRYWFLRSFSTPTDYFRYLLRMMLNDLIYVFFKGVPHVLFRAWADGLGPMPDSLKSPLLSSERDFVAKVNEVCSHFSFAALMHRIRCRSKKSYRHTP